MKQQSINSITKSTVSSQCHKVGTIEYCKFGNKKNETMNITYSKIQNTYFHCVGRDHMVKDNRIDDVNISLPNGLFELLKYFFFCDRDLDYEDWTDYKDWTDTKNIKNDFFWDERAFFVPITKNDFEFLSIISDDCCRCVEEYTLFLPKENHKRYPTLHFLHQLTYALGFVFKYEYDDEIFTDIIYKYHFTELEDRMVADFNDSCERIRERFLYPKRKMRKQIAKQLVMTI